MRTLPALAVLTSTLLTCEPSLAAQHKALIIDGQNNHNWRETTPHIKRALESSGLFIVEVVRRQIWIAAWLPSLLEALAKTPAERQALLQPYFEPTQQQREDSLKVPSAAHRAIASMVSGGYVRVIVTANFDRLMERALEAEGVSPMVISNPDQAEGAVPLAHRACSTSDCGSSFGRLRNRS